MLLLGCQKILRRCRRGGGRGGGRGCSSGMGTGCAWGSAASSLSASPDGCVCAWLQGPIYRYAIEYDSECHAYVERVRDPNILQRCIDLAKGPAAAASLTSREMCLMVPACILKHTQNESCRIVLHVCVHRTCTSQGITLGSI